LKQQFEHQQDASGWQIGSPVLFSMATLEGSLQVFNAVGMATIREVSLTKTAYLMYLIDERLAAYGYSYTNKQEDSLRGGHVCVVHREAYRIAAALRDHHVVPDFREPNVIRLAPIALYTSYEDIHKVVDTLEEIVREKIYLNYSNERSAVV
jgi:kynureninase